jgi:RNA-binding protein NOB1
MQSDATSDANGTVTTAIENSESDVVNEKKSAPMKYSAAQPSRIIGTGGSGVGIHSSSKQAEEDDGVGWIGPSNVKQCLLTGEGMVGRAQSGSTKSKKKKNQKPDIVERACRVACVTTDFTMQNVLMQMGLEVMSVDGMMITQVRQFVLRCGACYKVHYDMDRLFCSKCGSHMMQRIAASIDSKTGALRLHLKKNYHQNTRGMQHSLPAPGKQGKYEGELLLREDQLLTGIWRQKVVNIKKDVRSAFGEDITSDVGLQLNKGNALKIGLGRRNPNADKGRERRGKKKRN